MDERDWMAERFEEQRAHLRSVAYRMLGSIEAADDAVQEAWLRFSRSGAGDVSNLGGWLTTVVARVALNTLRERRSHREQSLDAGSRESELALPGPTDPEHEALLADSVGAAMFVVLDALPPGERVAFVLHDMFELPFEDIAPIVGRSSTAARQLASRARRRVRGSPAVRPAELAEQRRLAEAFLAASRDGDFEALLAVLDPNVVLRVDAATTKTGASLKIRGARTVARQALTFSARARFAHAMLINGAVGLVLAPRGRLLLALALGYAAGRIAELDVVADLDRLRTLELAVLESP